MGCPPIMNLVQRTRQLGEKEDGPVLEQPHSDRNFQEPDEREEGASENEQRAAPNVEQRERIKWPKSNETSKWADFESDVDATLELVLIGGVDRKINAMATLIYKIGRERFGETGRRPETSNLGETGHHNNGTRNKSRREREIESLRRDLKNLKQRFKVANESEKTALSGLRKVTREKLKSLRRAECSRKKRRERQRKRAMFTANPFRTITKLLGDKRSGTLKKSRNEIEDYLRQTHSDPQKGVQLDDNHMLPNPPLPASEFN